MVYSIALPIQSGCNVGLLLQVSSFHQTFANGHSFMWWLLIDRIFWAVYLHTHSDRFEVLLSCSSTNNILIIIAWKRFINECYLKLQLTCKLISVTIFHLTVRNVKHKDVTVLPIQHSFKQHGWLSTYIEVWTVTVSLYTYYLLRWYLFFLWNQVFIHLTRPGRETNRSEIGRILHQTGAKRAIISIVLL